MAQHDGPRRVIGKPKTGRVDTPTREGSEGHWRNRIVGHGVENPGDLLANPLNFRTHPQFQQDALAGMLNEVGYVQSIIVNQRTGHLIDGHLRVGLALERDEPSIPVVYVDLSIEEERLILVTLDPLGAMAETDSEQLDALLRDVSTGDDAIQMMLSGLAADAGLIPPDDPTAEWTGMPEFHQDDKTAYRSLHIHFGDEQSVRDFMDRIGQEFSSEAKYIWHPKQEREDFMQQRYAAE